ncbi:HAD hydrolase family protein [Enterococcus rivorum]
MRNLKIVATGRSKSSLDQLAVVSSLVKIVNPKIVCYNGNAIYDFKTKEFLVLNKFRVTENLIKKINTIGKKFVVDIDGQLYSNSKESRTRFSIINKIPKSKIIVGIPTINPLTNILSFQIYDENINFDNLKVLGNYSIQNYKYMTIVYPENTSKENGLKYMFSRDLVEYSTDFKIAIGNDINDIGMFQWSDFSIAVMNSSELVKKKTNKVLDQCLSSYLQKQIGDK